MYPERIVCLAAEIPEMLYRLGALDRVVGISAYTTCPAEDDVAAEHKAAYLLLSNRHDAPSEGMGAWLKRWRIEVLFHTVKQRT